MNRVVGNHYIKVSMQVLRNHLAGHPAELQLVWLVRQALFRTGKPLGRGICHSVVGLVRRKPLQEPDGGVPGTSTKLDYSQWSIKRAGEIIQGVRYIIERGHHRWNDVVQCLCAQYRVFEQSECIEIAAEHGGQIVRAFREPGGYRAKRGAVGVV